MYKHDTILPDANSKLSKKGQVAEMFNDIAYRYDFFNRFLSLGIDVQWRKKALRQLKASQPQILLDVATGTADVALMAHKLLKPKQIVGIDISTEMLKIGVEKVKKAGLEGQITLETGDAEAIKFTDNTFDAVTVAYGVRNFQDLEKGMTELLRVLKPNSKLVVLEFSKPKKKLPHRLYNLYMGIVAPKMVSVLSKNKKAYEYLNSSVNAFPEREHFVAVLNKVGFKNCFYKELSLGICCIYVAEK
jgi:demethylmenaquinone methyltransferase / 2-methoxy-6-polyprenyl-1,4-benzoquinol methylase